jgi:Mg/Co/Ni transporter MgtE
VDLVDMDEAVLLKRDVLDALVLDVNACAAARVNDLWLDETADGLCLQAADFSPWAVLRWILRGAFVGPATQEVVPWKDVEFLRGNPNMARREGDVHRIDRLRPPEIARMVDALPYLHAAELLALTPEPVAADALELMTLERQVQVILELDPEKGARLMGLIAPDHGADLLGWLQPEVAAGYLEALEENRRNQLIVLLGFPPDTAGGIMTNDIISVRGDLSVAEARADLKEALQRPDFVYYVYVLHPERPEELAGVLSLRDLLVADDTQLLTEIMQPSAATLDPLDPADAAAQRVADSHLAAMPVVGSSGKLLGAVTFDAAMVRLAPASWRDQAPRLFS